MAYWLFKEEPDHYSFADLQRDGKALWNGVKNPLARKHLRSVRKGDRVLYYHTGKEKAIVGEMKAADDAKPDPNDSDPNGVVIVVVPERAFDSPVPLSAIKQDPEFADWELVRLPRLSVMPVTPAQWRRIETLSKESRD
jgi:predicted RNA-binding protein with PUA-like domain